MLREMAAKMKRGGLLEQQETENKELTIGRRLKETLFKLLLVCHFFVRTMIHKLRRDLQLWFCVSNMTEKSDLFSK